MSYEMVEEKDLIRVRMFGVLTAKDLIEMQEEAARLDDGRDPAPNRLADLREVTEVRIGFPDVNGLAEARRTRRFPNSYKSAIVVANPVQSGMARMFRTLNDNPQIAIEIFTDEAKALVWLRS